MVIPRIVSLNVSPVREVLHRGQTVATGIFKTPAAGPIAITFRGLVGDDQADKRHHGWPTQAVYAYAAEEYDYWQHTLARDDLSAGKFGENMTVAGLDDDDVCIGDVYRAGSAELQVTFGREPCSTLAMAVGDTTFPKQFLARRKVGPYLQVLKEGDVSVGDALERVATHPARLSIREAVHLIHFSDGAGNDRERWAVGAAIEEMDERWRNKLKAKLDAIERA